MTHHARLDASGDAVDGLRLRCGNLLRTRAADVTDYTALDDWPLDAVLDAETFVSSSTLRRAQPAGPTSTTPHTSGDASRSVIQPVYNEANLLERVDVRPARSRPAARPSRRGRRS